LKTRSGSSASATRSSYSLAESSTVSPGQSDDPGGDVDLEVAHGQARVPRPVRAAEDSTYPREPLVVDEGLAQ
jgi:hypothetical protein